MQKSCTWVWTVNFGPQVENRAPPASNLVANALTNLSLVIQSKILYSPPSESPQYSWCNVSPSPTDVSPTENSWMLHPLDKVSLGYFAPDWTIPSLNSNWIERSDTRLPTAVCFSAAKRWSSMCGLSVHRTEGCQSNPKPGQGRRRSRPDAPLIHLVTEANRGRDSGRRSKFHACCGPGLGHIGHGQNIQGMLCLRDATSKNFRSGTHRSGTHQPCMFFNHSASDNSYHYS